MTKEQFIEKWSNYWAEPQPTISYEILQIEHQRFDELYRMYMAQSTEKPQHNHKKEATSPYVQGILYDFIEYLQSNNDIDKQYQPLRIIALYTGQTLGNPIGFKQTTPPVFGQVELNTDPNLNEAEKPETIIVSYDLSSVNMKMVFDNDFDKELIALAKLTESYKNGISPIPLTEILAVQSATP